MGNTVPTGNSLGNKLDLRTHLQDPGLTEFGLIKPLHTVQPRFLKTVQCRHKDGPVVVKIYVKWRQGVSLEKHARDLRRLRACVNCRSMCNVLPYQRLTESIPGKKYASAFLIRQYMASNLYDRLSTRPLLKDVEKRWIVYQLLQALDQCHTGGGGNGGVPIFHGDIKSENVLLTSWNWVMLSDFAIFKPTYLPDNDPAGFYYFFDKPKGRHCCYLAPERFYSPAVGQSTSEKATFASTGEVANLGIEGEIPVSTTPPASPLHSASSSAAVAFVPPLPHNTPPTGPIAANDIDNVSARPPPLQLNISAQSSTGVVAALPIPEHLVPSIVSEAQEGINEINTGQSMGEITTDAIDSYKAEAGTPNFNSPQSVRTQVARAHRHIGGLGPRGGQLTAAMDIFSAGCVIAELFLDGEPLFDLARLLRYRQHDETAISYVRDALLRISDPSIRGMVSSMLSVDPAQRLSAREYLVRCSAEERPRMGAIRCTSVSDIDDSDMAAAAAAAALLNTPNSVSAGTSKHPKRLETDSKVKNKIVPLNVFPWHFSGFVYGFVRRLVEDPVFLSADMKVFAMCKCYGSIVRFVAGMHQGDSEGEKFFATHLKLLCSESNLDEHWPQMAQEEMNSERVTTSRYADEQDEHIHSSGNRRDSKSSLDELMESLEESLMNVIPGSFEDEGSAKGLNETSMRSEGSKSSRDSNPQLGRNTNYNDREQNGLCIILELLCSCVQAVQGPECRITALHLIVRFSQYCDDIENTRIGVDGERHPFRSSNVRLHRLLPHIVLCLRDSRARVRAQAVHALTSLLESVACFSNTDANLFPDYIFPALLRFTAETDIMARLAFVECIGRLAMASKHFLDGVQSLKQAEAYADRNTIIDFDSTNSSDVKPSLPHADKKDSGKLNVKKSSSDALTSQTYSSDIDVKLDDEIVANRSNPSTNPKSSAKFKGESSTRAAANFGNDANRSSIFITSSYDFELSRLRDLVNKIIASLVGSSRPSAGDAVPAMHGSIARLRYDANKDMDREMRSLVKQTLLKTIAPLTCFFGKEKSNESLFPLMISFLNERDDWKLRAMFFQHITDVITFDDAASIVNFNAMCRTLLPCIEDGLRDLNEYVVEKTFFCLNTLISTIRGAKPFGGSHQDSISVLLDAIAPFLLHPCGSIRCRAVEFFSKLIVRLLKGGSIGINKSVNLNNSTPEYTTYCGGLVQTLVMPKLRNFILFELELSHEVIDMVNSVGILTRKRLEDISGKVAKLLTGILAEPVDRTILEQALHNPSTIMEFFEDNPSEDASAEETKNPLRSDDEKDSKFASFISPMAEMKKLKAMSGFIKVAFAQRKAAKGRHERSKMAVGQKDDHKNTETAAVRRRNNRMLSVYNNRIDISLPTHSIIIPDQRLCRSLYFAEATSSISSEDSKNDASSVQTSMNGKDSEELQILEFDANGHHMSETHKSLDDLVSPYLFNGFVRDGWKDSDHAAWTIATRYGAREHSVTIAGRLALRRRQMQNQTALKTIRHEEKLMKNKRQKILQQEARAEQNRQFSRKGDKNENLHETSDSSDMDRRRPSSFSSRVGRRSFTSFDANPSLLDGGGNEADHDIAVLQAAATAVESVFSSQTEDSNVDLTTQGKASSSLLEGSKTNSEPMFMNKLQSRSPYTPLTVAAARLFASGGVPPTELLARVRALELPPLPMNLGVLGLGSIKSSTDVSSSLSTSKYQSRPKRRTFRSLGTNKSLSSVNSDVNEATLSMSSIEATPSMLGPGVDRTLNQEPAFDLDSFDYGFPDFTIDGETNADKLDLDSEIKVNKTGADEDSVGIGVESESSSTSESYNRNSNAAVSAAMNRQFGSNNNGFDGNARDEDDYNRVDIRSLHWLRRKNRNGLYSWKPFSTSVDEAFGRVVRQRKTWLSRDTASGVLLSSETLGFSHAERKLSIESKRNPNSSSKSRRDLKGKQETTSNDQYIHSQSLRTSALQRESVDRIVRGKSELNRSSSMVLVASLRDHTPGRAIVSMAVAQDHTFFLTSSNDGTVRVWKSKGSGSMLDGGHHSVGMHQLASQEGTLNLKSSQNNLRTNVETQRGSGNCRPTGALCLCENSQTVAVATNVGHIELLRVDRMRNVSSTSNGPSNEASSLKSRHSRGVVSARIFRDSNLQAANGDVIGMEHLLGPTSSTLVYATESGVIRGLDLRMRAPAFIMRLRPQLGHVLTLAMSKGDNNGLGIGGGSNTIPSGENMRYGGGGVWAAVGTHRGYIAVWDLRFMTMSKLWKHSSNEAVNKLMTIDNQFPQRDTPNLENSSGGTSSIVNDSQREEISDHGTGSSADRSKGLGFNSSHDGHTQSFGRGFQPIRKASMSSFDNYMTSKLSGSSEYQSIDDVDNDRSKSFRADRLSDRRDPLVLAHVGHKSNDIAMWNLDTGVCEHVFRVLPNVVSEHDAFVCPSLESIPLAVDPGGLSYQPKHINVSGSQKNLSFETHSQYHSKLFLQGASSSIASFSKRAYRQFVQDKTSTKKNTSTMKVMLWTPDALPAASSPHLITAGTDPTIRIWDMRSPASSFALFSSKVCPEREYFDRMEGVSSKTFDRRTVMTVCQQTAEMCKQTDRDSPTKIFERVEARIDKRRSKKSGNFVAGAAAVTGNPIFSPAHQDAITDLKLTRSEEHTLLLSSGRDGVVNVWKADFLRQ